MNKLRQFRQNSPRFVTKPSSLGRLVDNDMPNLIQQNWSPDPDGPDDIMSVVMLIYLN